MKFPCPYCNNSKSGTVVGAIEDARKTGKISFTCMKCGRLSDHDLPADHVEREDILSIVFWKHERNRPSAENIE